MAASPSMTYDSILLQAALDFDGCISHPGILDRMSVDQIHAGNSILYKILAHFSKSRGCTEHFLHCASARQHDDINRLNSADNATASCFTTLEALPPVLKTHTGASWVFIKSLLADLFLNQPGGTHLASIPTADAKEVKQENKVIFDTAKLLIAYSQMHEVAIQKPNAQRFYLMIDDRKDITSQLHAFFLTHRHAIPKGTIFHACIYDGTTFTTSAPIIGTGPIDLHYQDTVKRMVIACGNPLLHPKIEINTYKESALIYERSCHNLESVLHARTEARPLPLELALPTDPLQLIILLQTRLYGETPKERREAPFRERPADKIWREKSNDKYSSYTGATYTIENFIKLVSAERESKGEASTIVADIKRNLLKLDLLGDEYSGLFYVVSLLKEHHRKDAGYHEALNIDGLLDAAFEAVRQLRENTRRLIPLVQRITRAGETAIGQKLGETKRETEGRWKKVYPNQSRKQHKLTCYETMLTFFYSIADDKPLPDLQAYFKTLHKDPEFMQGKRAARLLDQLSAPGSRFIETVSAADLIQTKTKRFER